MGDDADDSEYPCDADIYNIRFQVHDRQGNHACPQNPMSDQHRPISGQVADALPLQGDKKRIVSDKKYPGSGEFDKWILQGDGRTTCTASPPQKKVTQDGNIVVPSNGVLTIGAKRAGG